MAVEPATVICLVASRMVSTVVQGFPLPIAQSPLGLASLYTPASDVPGKGASKNSHNYEHHSSGDKKHSETS
jgi:hypothetical protein